VTLGRALLELQQYPEARTELEYVLHAAPDNLLALKCMNELQERAGAAAPEPAEARPHVQVAPEPPPAPEARPNLSFAARPAAVMTPEPAPVPVPEPAAIPEPAPEDPALNALTEWQARLEADRAQRAR
jgi:hypothetical protein